MSLTVVIVPFVLLESFRSCFSYFAFHSRGRVDLNVSVVQLCTELFKLSLALLTIYFRDYDWRFKRLLGAETEIKKLPFAIPAFLYLLNNLIFLSMLRITSPGLLLFCTMAKLPLTGLLHHFLIREQKNTFAWISLGCITFGLLVFSVPASMYSQDDSSEQAQFFATWYIAPIAGFTIAIFSALATISNEVLTKLDDFWVSQFWLYAWGALFAAIAYPLSMLIKLLLPAASNFGSHNPTVTSQDPYWASTIYWIVMVLVFTAGLVGLLTAIILRIGDSLIKVIAALLALVATCVFQYIVFPELRPTTLTPSTVFGGGIIIVSTWCYNYYKTQAFAGKPLPLLVVHAADGADDDNESGYALLPVSEQYRDSSEGMVKERLAKDEEQQTSGRSAPMVDLEVDDEDEIERPLKWSEPSATKVCVAAIIVIFLTIETVRYQYM